MDISRGRREGRACGASCKAPGQTEHVMEGVFVSQTGATRHRNKLSCSSMCIAYRDMDPTNQCKHGNQRSEARAPPQSLLNMSSLACRASSSLVPPPPPPAPPTLPVGRCVDAGRPPEGGAPGPPPGLLEADGPAPAPISSPMATLCGAAMGALSDAVGASPS